MATEITKEVEIQDPKDKLKSMKKTTTVVDLKKSPSTVSDTTKKATVPAPKVTAPLGEEDDEKTDSAVLGNKRSTFYLNPGKDMKDTKGNVTGRIFQGAHDFSGRTYIVRKGADYATELHNGKQRDVNLKDLHEEHSQAIKNTIDRLRSQGEQQRKYDSMYPKRYMSDEDLERMNRNIKLQSMKSSNK